MKLKLVRAFFLIEILCILFLVTALNQLFLQRNCVVPPRTESALDIPKRSSTQRNHHLPLAEIEIVVAFCNDDLRYLDLFETCDRIHIHIYSKCGEEVPEFKYVQDCVTVHRIENCGREIYAFFSFINERWDSLPDMGAFLQGSAITENPHVVHDVLNYLPGTTFASLSRMVWDAWHMEDLDKRKRFMEQAAPHVLEQELWLSTWRSQFIASRSAMRKVPRQALVELNQAMCNQTCGTNAMGVICYVEVWLGPMFGCAPYLFENNNSHIVVHKDTSLTVFRSDFIKDGIVKDYPQDTSEGLIEGLDPRVSTTTTQITEGNRTILYGKSNVNGLLTCLESNGDRRQLTSILLPVEHPSFQPKFKDERKENGERLHFLSV